MTIRSFVTVGLLIAAAVSGCAMTPSESLLDTSACPTQSTRVRARNDLERFEELQRRADSYAECMSAHGFTPNQDAIDDEVLRFEQIRNADRYGVDPQMSVRIREQELRLSPKYWRKSSAS